MYLNDQLILTLFLFKYVATEPSKGVDLFFYLCFFLFYQCKASLISCHTSHLYLKNPLKSALCS